MNYLTISSDISKRFYTSRLDPEDDQEAWEKDQLVLDACFKSDCASLLVTCNATKAQAELLVDTIWAAVRVRKPEDYFRVLMAVENLKTIFL